MIEYKDKIIPAVPEKIDKVFSKASCDICGKVSEKNDYDGIDWKTPIEYFEHTFVTISKEEKTSYPEGGDSETSYFEICDKCFDNKVRPFLESLGAKMYTKERDW
jgi:hypothetical protein